MPSITPAAHAFISLKYVESVVAFPDTMKGQSTPAAEAVHTIKMEAIRKLRLVSGILEIVIRKKWLLKRTDGLREPDFFTFSPVVVKHPFELHCFHTSTFRDTGNDESTKMTHLERTKHMTHVLFIHAIQMLLTRNYDVVRKLYHDAKLCCGLSKTSHPRDSVPPSASIPSPLPRKTYFRSSRNI